MSGSLKRARRRWSETFKRGVVAESWAPGVSVSAVARRHDLNANLLFNWRRRYGGDAGFLPVAVVDCASCAPGVLDARPGGENREAGEIEISLSAGHRVTIRGGFDGDEVAALLRGLVA